MMKFRPKKKMTSLSARGRKGNPAKKDNSNRDYHDVLEVCLDHGDIVVMQGRAIHREYDVSSTCPLLLIIYLYSLSTLSSPVVTADLL